MSATLQRVSPTEIYLDHCASAPLLPAARRALDAVLDLGPGNASSAHAAGRRLRAALETARERVAALIGARPAEIVFTSGATEATALALAGACAARRDRSGGRDALVGSHGDHEGTARLLDELARDGHPVRRANVDRAGRTIVASVREHLCPETLLVTVPHGQSVTGALTAIEELAGCTDAGAALLHVDAAQTAGRVDVDVSRTGIDLLTLSAHKLGGPQGIGALFVRDGAPWRHPWGAATHERGRRPGTPAVALAAAFGGAADHRMRHARDDAARAHALAAALRTALDARGDALVVTPRAGAVPGVCLFMVEGCTGEALLATLDAAGLRVSTGTACASGARVPPPVLVAGGWSLAAAGRAVRVSFGDGNTMQHVAALTDALERVVPRVRAALSTS